VHPKALLDFDRLPAELALQVAERIAGYASATEFFVAKVAEGVATIAAAFHPRRVIVRMSDFKSNEYSNLLGGRVYEPHEENPMLGFRGASRYVAPEFRDCFDLECRALKRVRDDMGFDNVEIMIPFVRTLGEAERVVELLAENGLRRGDNGLRLIMMCEVPSNALLADRFLDHFDGFSIGSNDLTQLTLGVDRDPRLPPGRQVHRDLRPGSQRPSGLRPLADGTGDREHLAQSRHGGRDLALPGGSEGRRAPGRRSFAHVTTAPPPREGHSWRSS
jgi:pyruvate,water dikinase